MPACTRVRAGLLGKERSQSRSSTAGGLVLVCWVSGGAGARSIATRSCVRCERGGQEAVWSLCACLTEIGYGGLFCPTEGLLRWWASAGLEAERGGLSAKIMQSLCIA